MKKIQKYIIWLIDRTLQSNDYTLDSDVAFIKLNKPYSIIDTTYIIIFKIYSIKKWKDKTVMLEWKSYPDAVLKISEHITENICVYKKKYKVMNTWRVLFRR